MRWSVVLGVVGLALLACAEPEQVQVTDRLNQMIPLIEQGLPVLGIAHPPYAARRRRGGRTHLRASLDAGPYCAAHQGLARALR